MLVNRLMSHRRKGEESQLADVTHYFHSLHFSFSAISFYLHSGSILVVVFNFSLFSLCIFRFCFHIHSFSFQFR